MWGEVKRCRLHSIKSEPYVIFHRVFSSARSSLYSSLFLALSNWSASRHSPSLRALSTWQKTKIEIQKTPATVQSGSWKTPASVSYWPNRKLRKSPPDSSAMLSQSAPESSTTTPSNPTPSTPLLPTPVLIHSSNSFYYLGFNILFLVIDFYYYLSPPIIKLKLRIKEEKITVKPYSLAQQWWRFCVWSVSSQCGSLVN